MVYYDQITSTLRSQSFVDVLIDTTNKAEIIILCHLPVLQQMTSLQPNTNLN